MEVLEDDPVSRAQASYNRVGSEAGLLSEDFGEDRKLASFVEGRFGTGGRLGLMVCVDKCSDRLDDERVGVDFA